MDSQIQEARNIMKNRWLKHKALEEKEIAETREKNRILLLMMKINSLLEFDKVQRSGYRITRFFKKYYFKKPINLSYIKKEKIPGWFLMRFTVTNKQTVPSNEQIIESFDGKVKKITRIKPKKKHKLIKKIDSPTSSLLSPDHIDNYNEDDAIMKAVQKSLNDNNEEEMIQKAISESQKTLNNCKIGLINIYAVPVTFKFSVVIAFDIRNKINKLETPIIVEINNKKVNIYLSQEQINKCNMMWSKINPESIHGHHRLIKLRKYKSLAKDAYKRNLFLTHECKYNNNGN